MSLLDNHDEFTVDRVPPGTVISYPPPLEEHSYHSSGLEEPAGDRTVSGLSRPMDG
ncbi:hypothetical protein AArc1_2359 [Natrarchaeobaculum sulfurireducens]|uniref:Uncharacterized protein n=1 Tax=Natrarchaeobaculum sulfurireducens TaxID=2044521 RepID=A0A346PGM9_9EURY|nr:hypothetical protein AArc1_2359 [Natrarchaeobaculum sulfurireducens]